MGDVSPKRKTQNAPETEPVSKGDEVPVHGKVLPHPDRERRLKSGIEDLSANFPNARQRASDAILRLIEMLSGNDHKLDHRRAEELKVKLIRALAVLEAIHNRPESVTKDELESLKQAMLLLHEIEQRESQRRSADGTRMPGSMN